MRRFWRWIKSKFAQRNAPARSVINNVPEPIIYNGEKINIKIEAMDGFTEEEMDKFTIATELVVEIINSLEFKTAVLNADLIRTNGLKNSEVYDLFMSGKDQYEETADHELDIKITLYYSRGRTVGYTYPGTKRTWINRKFFSSYGYETIVSNIVHEYCHNLGFTHPSRGYTHKNVPYTYGDVAFALCEMLLEGNELTPITKRVTI